MQLQRGSTGARRVLRRAWAVRPGWLCKAGGECAGSGFLHEAAGPLGAAAEAAEPGGAQSETGSSGVRVPVPTRLRTPPWAAAEASRSGGAQTGGRG